mgnify:FL=1
MWRESTTSWVFATVRNRSVVSIEQISFWTDCICICISEASTVQLQSSVVHRYLFVSVQINCCYLYWYLMLRYEVIKTVALGLDIWVAFWEKFYQNTIENLRQITEYCTGIFVLLKSSTIAFVNSRVASIVAKSFLKSYITQWFWKKVVQRYRSITGCSK